MQSKSFLQFIVITLIALCQVSTLHAQSRHNKKEEVIIIKKYKGPCDVSAFIKKLPDRDYSKMDYKPVPLAGQKAYFGEMNDYMSDFVKKYMHVHNKTLVCVKNRCIKAFPPMDTILKQNNIPKELKYLSVIESALNNNAISPVGAVGPWQLMTGTAHYLGINPKERRDWSKSTVAAAKYLSILYSQLNDWLLVIAAYNSGPGPVNRAIDRTGSHNFWDIKPYLPRETQGHVLAFIATASIFENLNTFIGYSIPEELVLDGKPYKVPVKLINKPALKSPFSKDELENMAIVRINKPVSMELMVQELGLDNKQMSRWNSDYELYEYNTYPTTYYNLRIPKDKLNNFLKKRPTMEKQSQKLFKEGSV